MTTEETLNILIVDDDEAMRMAIRQALQGSGHSLEIHEARNAMQAIERLASEDFDCAFLDYFLPDGDGMAMLQQVRHMNIQTPIVMLADHGDEQLIVSLIRAGALDYLSKSKLSADTLSRCLINARRLYLAEQQRQHAELELQQSNKKIIDILESISDAFFAVNDDWKFTYLNAQAEALLQANRGALLGYDIWEALPEASEWLLEALTKVKSHKVAVRAEGFYHPRERWLEVNAYPAAEGMSIYFRDITERKRVENRLNYLANYDELTGLPNRGLLMERLCQVLSRAPWQERYIAVMFCDLDRFKLINDTLGHNMGDRLLKVVANRLIGCVRSGDTVARIGGDEFVVLLTDMNHADDALAIAKKIINAVSTPLEITGHELFVTISLGISHYPSHGSNPETLLKNADVAMYRSKEMGKNTFHVYSPLMNDKAATRLSMEAQIRRAIEREEFVLHYQPQISILEHRAIAVEALIRWQQPDVGLIPPAQFLPIAEETGLIVAIGRWVLHTACHQAMAWHNAGLPLVRMAVNISNQQFWQEALVTTVQETLTASGLPAEFLELELTEDIIMKDVEQAIATLQELKALGIHLSIDDFGTGYSSLGQLKRFPFHAVKIDKSFVHDLTDGGDDAAITAAIIAMAHKMRLEVVAEGVETEEQYIALKQQGCDIIQGFLFSRGVPAADIPAQLRRLWTVPAASTPVERGGKTVCLIP